MNEEKKKRNKIIGISIGILVVLLVVISSTYAYWQITKSQKDPNQIVAACLDFDVNFPVGITEENKWPMSGTEAMSTIDGYTFTVTNNCPEDVTYVIGLESVTSQGITDYLKDSSVGIGFDGVNKGTYNSLTDLEGPTANARGSKKLQNAIVKGKSDVEGENVNTHNLKLWIDETSDAEEQSKGFSAKLFITGGQRIENDMPNELTAEACFEMDKETGTEIIGYDESCGDSVVIPATVKENPVKTIDSDAFRDNVVETVYYDSDIQNKNTSINAVDSVDLSEANLMFVFDDYKENTGIDLSVQNIIASATYIVKLTPDAPVNATVDGTAEQYGVTNKIKDLNNFPELEANQIGVYANLDATFKGPILGAKYLKSNILISITGLDLSQAYNLEKIEPGAFSNYEKGTDYSSAPSIAEQFSTKPVSLTSLKFAKTDKDLLVGWGAFNGIEIDTLEVYANLIIEELDLDLAQNDETYKEYIKNNWTDNYFAGAKINKLIVSSIGDDTIIRDGLFTYLIADQIIVNKGITEIGKMSFYGYNYWNLNSKKISLPNSLKKIGKYAFYDIENIVFESGTCDGIEIENPGWDSDTVVTPNTCQP